MIELEAGIKILVTRVTEGMQYFIVKGSRAVKTTYFLISIVLFYAVFLN